MTSATLPSFTLAPLGELDNREVPSYPVELTPAGFRADYISTVSNYSSGFKHLNPPGFKWRRLFETWLPFTAKLTVFFPNEGQLHILNAASPDIRAKRPVYLFRPAVTLTKARPYKLRLISIIRFLPRTKLSLRRNSPKTCPSICRRKSISARIKVPLLIARDWPGSGLDEALPPEKFSARWLPQSAHAVRPLAQTIHFYFPGQMVSG